MKISVIIPALNEAGLIAGTIQMVGHKTGDGTEVIVSDGGSVDRTAAVAQISGARVIVTGPGRGLQMDKGAREPLVTSSFSSMPTPRSRKAGRNQLNGPLKTIMQWPGPSGSASIPPPGGSASWSLSRVSGPGSSSRSTATRPSSRVEPSFSA